MISFVRTLVWLSFAVATAPAIAAPTVSDAWIRATPPGAVTAAAYLTITCPGAADRLVGAAAPVARTVEIHTNAIERGMERMVRLAELTLPAGEAVRLEPGGPHLMLIDLVQPLTAGTNVVLSLRFAEAGTVEIEVPVVDARAGATATHAGH